MKVKIERTTVRDGYDQWASTYDTTPNPLIILDNRYTINFLKPALGERILDALFLLICVPFAFFIFGRYLTSSYLQAGLCVAVVVFILV